MKNISRAGMLAGTLTALVIGVAPTATAHDGVDHTVGDTPAKGNPIAGVDFFGNHLDRYHFGRQILGFDRALADAYDWAVYHLIPVNLEVVARALSPAEAPDVEGDTWVETPAREAGDDDGGHGGPPSHVGYPLRVPFNPTAGLSYLSKWAADAEAQEAAPAVQEAARRTVTPTEQRPPNTVDDWSDKRPVTNEHGSAQESPVLLDPEQAAPIAQASKTAGTFTGGVLKTLNGGNEDSLLPLDGLLGDDGSRSDDGGH